ncbi:MAG: substrate-binding periplasmic protein, partial [Deefgea sp.]
MSAIQIWLKIKGVMIPKKDQVRRVGLCLSQSLFAFFLCQPLYAIELPAFTENLPPLNYEENGIAQGYSVELLQAIANEAGMKINIQVMPWARAYQTALVTPNALLFTLVRNPERENLFLWIGPIAKRKVFLFKLSQRNDITVAELSAAKKYRIGAVRE